MPLHEFKTQVLLLHSEQSTLDSLRSGFTESYTVHCATSGSEALNTLGDTPINVIVSAQDLPGMSGLEALREARKRSPDMIGILLAGHGDDGLEALVGDKEVFQIVRGNITADALLKLVEHATQQVRLMALAESANDNAADVDDDTAEEHIVMETSRDGATIISDGTGRMRALNPAAEVVVESAVGSRAVDLLVLTRDKEFLATIKESSRGTHTVHYASTLSQATDTIRENNVGVAVVDAGMVGDKIEQLTVHLRKASPRIVSIVAGRRDDGEMLMDLINRGKVYRFLLKPVSPGRARLAVESSVKHHLESADVAIETSGASPAAPSGPAAKAEPKPEVKPPPERRANKVVAKPRSGIAADPPPDVAVDAHKGSKVDDPGGASGAKRSGDDNAGAPAQQPRMPSLASATAGSGGSLLAKPKLLGAAVVAFVVIAGSLLWLTRDTDTAVAPDPAVANQQAIDEAAEGDDVTPVVDAPAANADGASLDSAVDQLISTAENAFLESRLEDAAAALRDVNSIDPDNARLQVLSSQLSEMQLSAHVADARLAIREQRFDDADTAIMAARALGIPENTDVDAVAGDLQLARSEQRAEDVLATANARLEDGDLVSPANDNARYYYELVLSDSPENAAARQGLVVIAGELALRARAAIESGNLDTAEELLGTANELDPSNSELAGARDALTTRREELAAERRREIAKRRADEEAAEAASAESAAAEAAAAQAAEARAATAEAAAAQAAADRAAAAEAAAAKAAADQAAAARAAAAQAAAAKAAADKAAAARAAAAEAAAAEAREIVPEKAAVAVPAEASPKVADDAAQTAAVSTGTTADSALNATPAMVSSLNRIKYVAPKYPRAAQRRNLSGWVDVVFTVDTDGTVKDIAATNSEPGETFVKAATRAVEKWIFEPVIQDGIAVEKRVGVRMMFALE